MPQLVQSSLFTIPVLPPDVCHWCGKNLKGRQRQWCCTKHKVAGHRAKRNNGNVTLQDFGLKQELSEVKSELGEIKHELKSLHQSLQSGPSAYNANGVNANQSPPPPSKPVNMDGLLEIKNTSTRDPRWFVPHCNLQIGLYHLGSIKHMHHLDNQTLQFGIHSGKLDVKLASAILLERGALTHPPLPGAAPQTPAATTPAPSNGPKAMDVPQFDVFVDDEEFSDLI